VGAKSMAHDYTADDIEPIKRKFRKILLIKVKEESLFKKNIQIFFKISCLKSIKNTWQKNIFFPPLEFRRRLKSAAKDFRQF
jgi:hypothetical protein